MYTIGQFSQITRLSIKMLRHYDEIGLLVPDHVSPDTGYRYYLDKSVERARIVAGLKELRLPLKTIAELIDAHDDDLDLIPFLEQHRRQIEAEIAHYESVRGTIDGVIASARAAQALQAAGTAVVERTLPPSLFASVRMTGAYADIGQAFRNVARRAGFKIAGPAKGLFHDDDYRESDAHFEGGFPVKAHIEHDQILCRELPGGTALTVVHAGPYDTIHASYELVHRESVRRGLTPRLPTREVYLKGPGMLFRGKPASYRTEIQFLLE